MEVVVLDNTENKLKREIVLNIGGELRSIISGIELSDIEEIRLRTGHAMAVHKQNKRFYVTDRSQLVTNPKSAHTVSAEEILKTLELVCESSVYAVQSEMKQGFVTIEGGHRVGITGKAVMTDNMISYIKDVSGLNIRIAHEIRGASDRVITFIANTEGVNNTLIIAPPQCGKTTMVRDIARSLSPFYKVGIVDERSEIAACYKGVPQFELGEQTDVLDACPKSQGMLMMMRSMSPEVIITDELGTAEDIAALSQVINSGVKVITTVHGYGREDIVSKEIFKDIYSLFDCVIVLSKRLKTGTVEEVYHTKRKDRSSYA